MAGIRRGTVSALYYNALGKPEPCTESSNTGMRQLIHKTLPDKDKEMPKITLPDGTVREYNDVTHGAEIAANIGEGLARSAVAVRVNGTSIPMPRSRL
jgi:hypothetical protein